MTRFFPLALSLSVSAIALCVALSGCSKQSERERLQKEIAVAEDSLKFYNILRDSLRVNLARSIPRSKNAEMYKDAQAFVYGNSEFKELSKKIGYFSSLHRTLEFELSKLPPDPE